jgi:hypothetical protein
MPRRLPWLALAASTLTLTGCGSSANDQATTGPTGSTATGPSALAQAIVLRRGDAPGFRLATATPASAEPLVNGTCAVQTTGALAQASSPTLLDKTSAPPRGVVTPEQSSRQTVLSHEAPLYALSSLVLVDTEATEAETQLFAAIGAGAKACLQKARKAIVSDGHSTPTVTVSAISKPVPGLPIYGLRRTQCLVLSKTCGVTASEDRYFFAVGRVLVGVQATSSSGPFPAILAHHLLTLTYQRAQAHTP